MKKLMFASAAAALASAAFATVGTSTGFEEYAAANVTHIAGYSDDGTSQAAQDKIYWTCTGEQGGTAVSNHVNTPATPTGGFPGSGLSWGDNYLDLNTENEILWRSVNPSQDGTNLGEAQAIESALYIDTMVQFTVTEAGNEPTDLDATDKLAIWLGTVTNAEGEVTSTNLFVRALMVGDNDEVTSVATNFKLTKQGVVPGTWYRLTVKAIKDATWRGRVTSKAEEGQPDGAIVAYEIYLDQEKLYTDVDTFTEEYVDLASGFSDGWLDEDEDDEQAVIEAMQSKGLFPSLVGPSTLATLQGVGFKGSGAIDDLVVGDTLPNFLKSAVDLALNVPASGVDNIQYKLNDGEWLSIPSPATVKVRNGDVVSVRGTVNGHTKTVTVTATGEEGESITLPDASIAYFFDQEGRDGSSETPYFIGSVDDFTALKDAVQAGYGRNLAYQMTNDVDFANATFAGIGTYVKKDTSTLSLEAGAIPFQGTFDGNGKKIQNVKLASTDKYAGFFNFVLGTEDQTAVVKNFTIENLAFDGSTIGGGAFIGAAIYANLEDLTFKSAQALTGSHNTAGIACCARGNVTFTRCVNEASITVTGESKIAGITAIAEDGPTTFSACANKGAISGGIEGAAGLANYVSKSLTVNAFTNTGVITVSSETVNTAKFVAAQVFTWGSDVTALNWGAPCVARDDAILTSTGYGVATPVYAQVTENNTMTFPATLAKGGEYYVLADVAASETPVFTLDDAGDYIAFNTNAFTHTFAGTVTASDDTVVVTKDAVYTTGSKFVAAAHQLEGSGTAEDPWQLADVTDLKVWAKDAGATYKTNDCYKLTNNITVDNATVPTAVPLFPKWGTLEFSGTFDGNGKTITYTLTDTDENHGRFGLFGKARNATFKNLTVNGSYGEGTTSSGAIVLGQGYGNITFQNVTAQGAISVQSNVAGLLCNWKSAAATDRLTFTACTNEATLTTGYTKAGGMVAYDEDFNTRSNDGIVFVNCLNKGAITCDASYVVKQVETAAGVTNTDVHTACGAWVGGMIGWAGYYKSITMTNCRNEGTLSAKQWTCGFWINEKGTWKNSGNAKVCIGGLVGNTGISATLDNCSNAGSITGSAHDIETKGSTIPTGGIGGLFGVAGAITLKDCANTGSVQFGTGEGTVDISAFTKIGSLVGWNTGAVTRQNTVTATANMAPAGKTPCAALAFATVADDVATFVDPAAGGSYKVMLGDASFELAAADATITLDETLTNATVTVAAALADAYTLKHEGNVYSLAAKTIAVTGVTLSETTTNLTVGASCTLTATVAPEDAADKSVTWSTSDGEVATVADGVVTAVKAGTATITVTTTDGGKTATCTVTVSAASGPTIEPGETSTTSTATTPEEATNEVVMVSPDAEVVNNEDYKKYFKFTVTGVSGNYTVTAALNEDAIALDETVEDVATTGIAEVLKVEAGEDATASVEAKPGLWYSASVVTGLAGADWAAGEGARTQATGATVDLKIKRPSSGNACFIKVMVNTADKK